MDAARKRPLPIYPDVVGLVTSPRGAAVPRRAAHAAAAGFRLRACFWQAWPWRAPPRLRASWRGMRQVVAAGAEVVLVVRGGGSFEDLMTFSDERLARTIARCPVPVVTGIGHEPDTTIADMVADVRASTPTAAAEAVSPARESLERHFSARARTLAACAGRAVERAGRRRAPLRDEDRCSAMHKRCLPPKRRRSI